MGSESAPASLQVRRVDSADLAALRFDALVLLLPQRPLPLAGVAGLVDFAAGGRLSRAYQGGALRFTLGERALLPAPAAWRVPRLLCVGLGEPRALTAPLATATFAAALAAARGAGAPSLAAALPALGLSAKHQAQAGLQATLLRALEPVARAYAIHWLR